MLKFLFGIVFVTFLLGCHEGESAVSKRNYNGHDVVVVSKSKFQTQVVYEIAENALDRAEETLCALGQQSLVLYDYSDLQNSKNLIPKSTEDAQKNSVMPFYLKGITKNEEHISQSLEQLIVKNSILQHEIGHLILMAEFPPIPSSSSIYGSSLPDWIDEMAAILHDDAEKEMMRLYHFTELVRENMVLKPSSLMALDRGKDPFIVQNSEPESGLDFFQFTYENNYSFFPSDIKTIPIEDYYSELAMLLVYFKEEYGEDCLVNTMISLDKTGFDRSNVDGGSIGLDKISLDSQYERWLRRRLTEANK